LVGFWGAEGVFIGVNISRDFYGVTG